MKENNTRLTKEGNSSAWRTDDPRFNAFSSKALKTSFTAQAGLLTRFALENAFPGLFGDFPVAFESVLHVSSMKLTAAGLFRTFT